jgi:hypothetical protein
MTLYLDGQRLGTANAVAVNSLALASNSFIVFGAAKFMDTPTARARILDGMVDQVEMYDQALTPSQALERYQAFAVPEPSGVFIGACAVGMLVLRRHAQGRR